jgi:hypothetical protein
MKKAKATMDATSVELERRRGTREIPCLQDVEEKQHRRALARRMQAQGIAHRTWPWRPV